MSKTPVVVLGTGDVLRALDREGEWYWTGAKPEEKREGKPERVRDREVMTRARPREDNAVLAAILAAGEKKKTHRRDAEAQRRSGGVAKWRSERTGLRARLCALCASVVTFLDRDRLWLAVLVLFTCMALAVAGGCAARVGTRFDQDQAGRSSINGGPNRLAVNFPDSETTSTEGVGPSSYSVTSGDEVRTLNQGVTPRQIFFKKLPDGTLAVNVSSGSDVEAEGLVYEPESGTFAVEKFRTLTSEPIRAGNEGYAALVDYWKARDDASRAVLIEQIKASTEIATDLKGVLIGALTGIP